MDREAEFITWCELMWDGIKESNGEHVRGQLIRRREADGSIGHWICTNPYLITFENGDRPAIGGWVKVRPESLNRVEYTRGRSNERYELLRRVYIDLGEIGDDIQIDLNRNKKILRLTLFKDDHYQDEVVIDLADEFGE